MFVTIGALLVIFQISEYQSEVESLTSHLGIVFGFGIAKICLDGGIGGDFTDSPNHFHEHWINFLYGPVAGMIIYDLWVLSPKLLRYFGYLSENSISNDLSPKEIADK